MSVGQSDKAKVEQLFGKPAKVETVSPGVEKYIYTYRTMDPEWYTIDKTQNQAFRSMVPKRGFDVLQTSL